MKRFFLVFSAAALVFAAVPLAFVARGRLAQSNSAARGAYLGFDRDIYPGDAAFTTLRKTFAFTGYWLGPPPGEKSTTWIGKRDFLRGLGFGFLVLYRGRDSREFRKESDGPAKGLLDAKAAASAAKKEGFPPNSIIFLDVEEGGRLTSAYHAYLHAWNDELGRDGYRAGVYCSGMPARESGGITILTADDIRAHAGDRDFTFFVYNDACPPSPGCSFSSAAPAPAPAASGVAYAQAWQFAQSPRRKEFTPRCPTGYHPNGNCYGPGDTGAKWELDADTALSADPSGGSQR